MKDRIWLTWERQRRSRTLSAALGAELHELDYALPRLRRWSKSIAVTLRILARERPQLIFAQNPSLVLSLLVVWYGRLTGRATIIDAHNAGVFPFSDRHKWHQRLLRPLLQRIADHTMRLADLTIVSNPALGTYVEAVGGRSCALPDPLPSFPPQAAAERSADRRPMVLFICTWAPDEPYQEVIKAAARLDPRIQIYVTGNSKGRERGVIEPLPPNLVLTGFVPEDEFVRLLHQADVVMDLTTFENCLVCGAYEAVAAGKPMVLSSTEALRAYFRRGAVYTASDAAAIAEAIGQALAAKEQLSRQVEELRSELAADWSRRQDQLEALLSGLHPRSAAAAPKP